MAQSFRKLSLLIIGCLISLNVTAASWSEADADKEIEKTRKTLPINAGSGVVFSSIERDGDTVYANYNISIKNYSAKEFEKSLAEIDTKKYVNGFCKSTGLSKLIQNDYQVVIRYQFEDKSETKMLLNKEKCSM